VPDNLEDLVALPGVGNKMAHLLLQEAFNKVEGISVDTHVHRIANRLKWVKNPTKNPDDTAKALEEWLPKTKWRHINPLLVGFGQTICKPIGPRCWECPVNKLCKFK
jgi:endonuclease-3